MAWLVGTVDGRGRGFGGGNRKDKRDTGKGVFQAGVFPNPDFPGHAVSGGHNKTPGIKEKAAAAGIQRAHHRHGISGGKGRRRVGCLYHYVVDNSQNLYLAAVPCGESSWTSGTFIGTLVD
jgi:hypothetical protein